MVSPEGCNNIKMDYIFLYHQCRAWKENLCACLFSENEIVKIIIYVNLLKAIKILYLGDFTEDKYFYFDV